MHRFFSSIRGILILLRSLKRPAFYALWMLFFLVLMAILGPWLSPYSYAEIHLECKNTPPTTLFWFGTDELGRDLFTRIWWGARISLFIGIAAALLDALFGVLWGATAAFFG